MGFVLMVAVPDVDVDGRAAAVLSLPENLRQR
jgi:hypothetical protein